MSIGVEGCIPIVNFWLLLRKYFALGNMFCLVRSDHDSYFVREEQNNDAVSAHETKLCSNASKGILWKIAASLNNKLPRIELPICENNIPNLQQSPILKIYPKVRRRLFPCNAKLSESGSQNVMQDGGDNQEDDERKLLVAHSKSGTKKNFCLFCAKLVAQLPRHLTQIHSDEEIVKKFKVLPKGTMERVQILNNLRKQGNFKYNTDKSLNQV